MSLRLVPREKWRVTLIDELEVGEAFELGICCDVEDCPEPANYIVHLQNGQRKLLLYLCWRHTRIIERLGLVPDLKSFLEGGGGG